MFGDHLVFRKYSDVFPRIYFSSLKLDPKSETRNQLISKCSFTLNEFEYIHIIRKLENNRISEKEIKNISDFSIRIMMVFNRLQKISIDNRRWDDYEIFSESLYKVFTNFDEKFDATHLELLELQGNNKNVNNSDIYSDDFRHIEAVLNQKKRVQDFRKWIFLGIGAWFIHLYISNKIEDSEYLKEIYYVSREFINIESLSEIFEKKNDQLDFDDLLDWTSWELNERIESGAQTNFKILEFDQWLSFYYYLRMLDFIQGDNSTLLPELKPSRMSGQNLETVKNVYSTLKKDQRWAKITKISPSEFEQKSLKLISMHEKAWKSQIDFEMKEIKSSELDSEIQKTFIKDFQSEWESADSIRKLFSIYRRYDLSLNENLVIQKPNISIDLQEDKAAFVKQDYIHYPPLGKIYANRMIIEENRFLLNNISQNRKINCEKDDLETILELQIEQYHSLGYKPILLCNRVIFSEILLKSQKFQSRWNIINNENDTFHSLGNYSGSPIALQQLNSTGNYSNSPVIPILSNSDPQLIIIDFQKFANVRNYRQNGNSIFPIEILFNDLSKENISKVTITMNELLIMEINDKNAALSIVLDS